MVKEELQPQVAGLKVKCPNCKRLFFKTTDKYDPDKSPNGSMVKSLLPYQIDWLCSSTTLTSELTCPECLAQLAPAGRLIVEVPKQAEEQVREEFVCSVCGQTFQHRIALAGHVRSHKKNGTGNDQ